MEGARLFYDSYVDALRDDVNALGGPKDVGKWFWAEKSIEAARNMLNDCLNDNRRERLTDEQERLIMRKARAARGFSAALYFICDDTQFERPKALNPEDERAKRERELIDTVRRAEQLAAELRKLLPGAPLQAINGGKS